MKSKNYYLLPDKIVNNTQSIEELINLMHSDKNGNHITGFSTSEEFLDRYNSFEEVIKRDLPDFTHDELLKVFYNLETIKQLFGWSEFNEFCYVMEFKLRKNQKL